MHRVQFKLLIYIGLHGLITRGWTVIWWTPSPPYSSPDLLIVRAFLFVNPQLYTQWCTTSHVHRRYGKERHCALRRFSLSATSVLEDAPLSVGVETLPGIQTEVDRGRLVT